MKLFTLGADGRGPEEVVRLLADAGVRTVLDVRLPESLARQDALRELRQSVEIMEDLLSRQGIAYRPVAGLGNIFLECEDWRSRYETVLSLLGELLTAKLQTLDAPLCLLGTERRAADCHRWQIGDFLAARGHQVEHLDGE